MCVYTFLRAHLCMRMYTHTHTHIELVQSLIDPHTQEPQILFPIDLLFVCLFVICVVHMPAAACIYLDIYIIY